MNQLNFSSMEEIQGGDSWTKAGLACFGAGLATAAVIGSGPFAPGVAMFVGWGLGTAIGTCIGLVSIS